MKGFNTPEPTTSAAAGAGWLAKMSWAPLIAGLLAIGIALETYGPKTRSEWIRCVLIVGSFSIFGGSALIDYFGFQAWSQPSKAFFHLSAGIVAWLLSRPLFLWFQRRANKDIGEQAKEVKDLIKKD